MKGIVRHQSSARPEHFGAIKVRKPRKRDGPSSKPNKRFANTPDFYMVKGHGNNQMRSCLAKMTIKEKRTLSVAVSGAGRRRKEQLCALGKLDRHSCIKTEHNVPARWAGHVPEFVPFTVEALLRAMVLGLIKPLYDIQGKHACAAADE